MFSNAIRASRTIPPVSRLFHASSVTAAKGDHRLSQGSVSKPDHKHPGDPHDQAARRGQDIGHGQQHASSPYDAASRTNDKKADFSGHSGNQEGVGFADQVGSASATADKGQSQSSPGEGKGAEEESTPPGLMAAIKSKLGFGTTSGEAKQNRGGGVGVTGTGALPFEKTPQEGRRPYHTTAARASSRTQGQAPEDSRQPHDRTYGEQNAHLKHKSSTTSPDHGKGNADKDPKLPSHELSKKTTPSVNQQKRSFSTTRFVQKHTAESYFKDVDNTPASSQKTHQVDGSATGSDVQRPDTPLTGQYSRAGAHTKEYETVSQNDQYDVPPSSGPDKDQKQRYGNMPDYGEDHSKSGEGPEGDSKGGRKPEGRA
ncbi:hypothetical protein C8Q80DRAFT_1268457 [Daedaleopsis nitida]|nr:hypothetical protein C8Q80DRAFT_1268457 [Daedaleopsis nitida]